MTDVRVLIVDDQEPFRRAMGAVVEATEPLGTSSLTVPFASDTRPPIVRFVPGQRVRVSVSEPATLVLRIGGRPSRLRVGAPGVVAVPSLPGQP